MNRGSSMQIGLIDPVARPFNSKTVPLLGYPNAPACLDCFPEKKHSWLEFESRAHAATAIVTHKSRGGIEHTAQHEQIASSVTVTLRALTRTLAMCIN